MVREAAPSSELEKHWPYGQRVWSKQGGSNRAQWQSTAVQVVCHPWTSSIGPPRPPLTKVSFSFLCSVRSCWPHMSSEPATALAGGGLVCFKPLSKPMPGWCRWVLQTGFLLMKEVFRTGTIEHSSYILYFPTIRVSLVHPRWILLYPCHVKKLKSVLPKYCCITALFAL